MKEEKPRVPGTVLGFFKESVTDALNVLTSKERIRGLYGVSLYRNAIYLMLNSSATALLGFVFWIMAARLYPTEAVGLASAAISAMGLLSFLASLGLGYGLIRFLPGAGANSKHLINSVFTLCGLVALILVLIFIAGLHFWSPALLFLRQKPVYLAAFVAFTVVATLAGVLGSTFIARRKAEFSFAQSLTFSLIKVGLVILMAHFFASFGIFASWGLGIAAGFLLGMLFLLPRVEPGYKLSPSLKRETLKEVMHFSFANYTAQFFWSAPGLILPIMIVNLLGADQNAYFYVSWAMAGIASAIGTSAATSLLVEGSHAEEELRSHIRRSIKLTLVLIIPTVVLMTIFGNKLLRIFGGVYSESGTRLLWLLALASIPLSLNWIYFGKKMVQRQMKPVILLNGLMAVSTLGISYILLSHVGITGVGIAWLASQSMVAVVLLPRLLRNE